MAIATMLSEVNSAHAGMIDLPQDCKMSSKRRLLRYPLLVDKSLRDELYKRLLQSGLGPSLMYPAALPGVSGVPALFEGQGSFPMAESFARRIITLPTHSGVSTKDIAHIRQILTSK